MKTLRVEFSACSTNITKLCVASREYEFRSEYEHWQKLRMEDQNKEAITAFALRRMASLTAKADHPLGQQTHLANLIGKKSEGVFLWAELATRELCECYMRRKDLQYLERRIERLPTELSGYYDRVIEQMKNEQADWIRTMKIIASSQRILHLSELYHAVLLLEMFLLSDDKVITNKNLEDFEEELVYETKGLIHLDKQNYKETTLCWVTPIHRSFHTHLQAYKPSISVLQLWISIYDTFFVRNVAFEVQTDGGLRDCHKIFHPGHMPIQTSSGGGSQRLRLIAADSEDNQQLYRLRQISLHHYIHTLLPDLILHCEQLKEFESSKNLYKRLDRSFCSAHLRLCGHSTCDKGIRHSKTFLESQESAFLAMGTMFSHNCIHAFKYMLEQRRLRYSESGHQLHPNAVYKDSAEAQNLFEMLIKLAVYDNHTLYRRSLTHATTSLELMSEHVTSLSSRDIAIYLLRFGNPAHIKLIFSKYMALGPLSIRTTRSIEYLSMDGLFATGPDATRPRFTYGPLVIVVMRDMYRAKEAMSHIYDLMRWFTSRNEDVYAKPKSPPELVTRATLAKIWGLWEFFEFDLPEMDLEEVLSRLKLLPDFGLADLDRCNTELQDWVNHYRRSTRDLDDSTEELEASRSPCTCQSPVCKFVFVLCYLRQPSFFSGASWDRLQDLILRSVTDRKRRKRQGLQHDLPYDEAMARIEAKVGNIHPSITGSTSVDDSKNQPLPCRVKDISIED